jgi:hypothetical protein
LRATGLTALAKDPYRMRQKVHEDLTPFNQFVDFLFARVVHSESRNQNERGYFNTEVRFDAHRVRGYYVQLFRNSALLLDSYSDAQLEQGLSAITLRSLSCSVRQLIWSRELAFAERAECVRSMFYFCRDVFRHDAIGFTASIWWETFCFDWECGNRRRSRGGEDLLMQDVLFGMLSQVVLIDSSICRGSALHGLEHLHHPETLALIGGLIRSHPQLAEELTEYAYGIRGCDPLWMRGASRGD